MKVKIPIKGYVRNPMMRIARNMRCPCDSGKKWKVCCLQDTPMFIKQEDLGTWTELFNEAIDGKASW